MVLENISRDILLVVVFLIPGYLGFYLLLKTFVRAYPAFTYQNDDVNETTKLLWAVIWSSVTYYLLFGVKSFEDMTGTIDFQKFAVMILTASGMALLIGAIITAGIFYTIIGNTVLSFLTPEKNAKIFSKKFWSRHRMKIIFEHQKEDYEEVFSSPFLLDILRAARKQKQVNICLKNGNVINGKLELKESEYLKELVLVNKKSRFAIKAQDIQYIESVN